MDIKQEDLDFMCSCLPRFERIFKDCKKIHEDVIHFNSPDDLSIARRNSVFSPDEYYYFKFLDYGVSIVRDSWHTVDKSSNLCLSHSNSYYHVRTFNFYLSDRNYPNLFRPNQKNNFSDLLYGTYGCFDKLSEAFLLFFSACVELINYMGDNKYGLCAPVDDSEPALF